MITLEAPVSLPEVGLQHWTPFPVGGDILRKCLSAVWVILLRVSFWFKINIHSRVALFVLGRVTEIARPLHFARLDLRSCAVR